MAGISIKPAAPEETEAFIQQNKRWLPDDAEQVLRAMSGIDQRRVISAGTMSSVRDPAAVIQARVRKAKEMEVQINRGHGAGDTPNSAHSQGTADGQNSKGVSREDVEAFIKANERWLQGEAEDILLNMNSADQKRVIAGGTMSGCRDPVAVIQTRAKKAREMEAEIEGVTKQAPPPPPPQEPPPPLAPTFNEAAAAMHMFSPAAIVSRTDSKFAPPPSVLIKDDSVPMVGEERGVGGVVEILKPKYGCGKGHRLKVIGETGNLLQFEGGKTAPKNHENSGWKWVLKEEEDSRLAAAKAADEAQDAEMKEEGDNKRSGKKRKQHSSSPSSSSSLDSSSSSSYEAKKRKREKRRKTKKGEAAKTAALGVKKPKVTKSSSSSSSSAEESVMKAKDEKNGVINKTSLVDGALGIAQRLLLEAKQKVAREAATLGTTPDARSEVLPEPVSHNALPTKTKASSSSSSSSSSCDEAKENNAETQQIDLAVSNGSKDAGVLGSVVSNVMQVEKERHETAAEEKSSSSSSSSRSEAVTETKGAKERANKEHETSLERGNTRKGPAEDNTKEGGKQKQKEKGKKKRLVSSASSEPRKKKESTSRNARRKAQNMIQRSSSSRDGSRSADKKRRRKEKDKQKEKKQVKDKKARDRSRSKDKRKEKSRSRDAKVASKSKAKQDTSSSAERQDKSRNRRGKENNKEKEQNKKRQDMKKAKRKSSSSSSSSSSS